MNLKKYAILILLQKFLFKVKSCYFCMVPKSTLPERKAYSGLVGCGNFARYAYVPAINKYKNPIVISALCSRSKSSALKLAKALRYETKIFDSYDDFLDSGIQSVIIIIPNHLHYEYIVKALARGMDVFCEKPVVNNLKDAIALKSVVDKSQKVLMVGFNERYFDRIQKVKSFILSGRLGEVVEVNAFHNQNIEQHLCNSEWLVDVQKSGGGVLYNAGVHLLNVILDLFGEVKSVTAKLENKKLPVNYGEDTAVCELFFKNSIVAKLNMSYVGGVDSTYEHMVIKGEKGVLVTDMLKGNITFYEHDSGRSSNIACKKEIGIDSIFNELSHFYECVEGRRSPDTDIDDSINTLIVIEAMHEASKVGSVVNVDAIRNNYV